MEERENLPQRRFKVVITIGADSEEEVERALRNIHFDWCGGTRVTVSGGCSSGWHITVKEDPDMTAEKYKAYLAQYLKADK